MPGLREVQLWADVATIDAGFEDIQSLAANCRFRDCAHAGEPGCAVAAGLDATRLANYHKMRREVGYLAIKADPELERQRKTKWKAIHKAMRKNPKRDL
jgi:ribosome biogenesis GTPase